MALIDTPRNSRSLRTRAAILDAAWRLLETHGAGATSMEAVAHAAGVTRRGLYLHFPSRADLLVALVEHVDETLDLAASVRPVVQAPDALAALDAWAWHLTRYHSRIRAAMAAVDRERSTDAGAAALWAVVMERWRSACQNLAQRLEQEGSLASTWTSATAAAALWSLMLAFSPMWQALVEDSGWSVEEFGAFLARVHRATFGATSE